MKQSWPTNLDTNFLQSFFIKSMLDGFIAGKEPKASLRSGYVCLEFSSGEFHYIDTWMGLETPKGSTHGEIIIFFRGIPVWYMQYCGYYPKQALPILKLGLTAAYGKNLFVGGRGIPYLEFENFKYTNHVDFDHNTFSDFKGFEKVHLERRSLGTHEYRGGLII